MLDAFSAAPRHQLRPTAWYRSTRFASQACRATAPFARADWQAACAIHASNSTGGGGHDASSNTQPTPRVNSGMWTQVMLKTLGNNLYVTVLSPRVTDQGLKKHFSTEGEVIDASIVYDPWTREPRGFGFVTMAATKEADHCIKYLDCYVLQGQVIIVEKNILLFCLHHRESEIASHSLHIHKVLLDCDDVQADARIVDRLAAL
ncbi:Serine/arginine-rich splicing factor SR45a [Zea mays]|uniref:Serine/arginine-rich splicing factor SR45a n=1 Tax=Zea mays TaxID=4577 RepID=A0A3L6GCK6_MAIZE|nr:Serine/arginine-rich splicing factor SR45a [Zea mays]